MNTDGAGALIGACGEDVGLGIKQFEATTKGGEAVTPGMALRPRLVTIDPATGIGDPDDEGDAVRAFHLNPDPQGCF